MLPNLGGVSLSGAKTTGGFYELEEDLEAAAERRLRVQEQMKRQWEDLLRIQESRELAHNRDHEGARAYSGVSDDVDPGDVGAVRPLPSVLPADGVYPSAQREPIQVDDLDGPSIFSDGNGIHLPNGDIIPYDEYARPSFSDGEGVHYRDGTFVRHNDY